MKKMILRTRLMTQCLLGLFCLIAGAVSAQSTWTLKTPPPAPFTARNACAGFAIGSKGYFGLGGDSKGETADFYEYNPASDTWTKKANFGGKKRQAVVSFSIGNKGYVGLGDSSGVATKDFWEYDPSVDTWTKKADFPGIARTTAIGFSIGSKGYVGLGDAAGVLQKDFYEYNPSSDTWTTKASFGGTGRSDASAFSIGNKGYVGAGDDGTVPFKKDFWQYDPATDKWTAKSDFGGGPRTTATAFSLNGKGYLGAGDDGSNLHNDFWQYDTAANTWTQIPAFTGAKRSDMVGFAIGSKAYVGNGNLCGAACYTNDWYEFAPGVAGIHNLVRAEDIFHLYPNPSAGTITLHLESVLSGPSSLIFTDARGRLAASRELHTSEREIQIDLNELDNGLYFVQLLYKGEQITAEKIMVLK